MSPCQRGGLDGLDDLVGKLWWARSTCQLRHMRLCGPQKASFLGALGRDRSVRRDKWVDATQPGTARHARYLVTLRAVDEVEGDAPGPLLAVDPLLLPDGEEEQGRHVHQVHAPLPRAALQLAEHLPQAPVQRGLDRTRLRPSRKPPRNKTGLIENTGVPNKEDCLKTGT